MHPYLDRFLDEILQPQQPLGYQAVYPRRILPPTGFPNPRNYSATIFGQLMAGFSSGLDLLPHSAAMLSSLALIEHRVPTYFVRSEFAQAVAQTSLPDDGKFSEIRWPLDAMLFVLPLEFALKYFGFRCPFIAITRNHPGTYPDDYRHLPPCEQPLSGLQKVRNEVDRLIIAYTVYSADPNTVPADYSGVYNMSMSFSQIGSMPMQDASYLDEQNSPLDSQFKISGPDIPATDSEAEQVFGKKVQTFAIKLMLAMTARPELLANGELARAAGTKKGGRPVADLWHPNLIGWKYRAGRQTDNGGQTGTHASPRLHWRMGHLRKQPHGPKPWTEHTPKRLLWIEPVLVNAV